MKHAITLAILAALAPAAFAQYDAAGFGASSEGFIDVGPEKVESNGSSRWIFPELDRAIEQGRPVLLYVTRVYQPDPTSHKVHTPEPYRSIGTFEFRNFDAPFWATSGEYACLRLDLDRHPLPRSVLADKRITHCPKLFLLDSKGRVSFETTMVDLGRGTLVTRMKQVLAHDQRGR